MKIGYARVSTYEQTLDMQMDALNKQECDRIYSDKISGIKEVRPNWDKVMELARAGDTIVVWRLDRIGRGMKNLLEIMDYMEKNDINLRTLTGIEIDTSTATGRLIFRVYASIIEYEREQTIERTLAGLTAARARGRKGGRPLKLDEKAQQVLRRLYNERDTSGLHKHDIAELCKMFKISEPTLFRYINGKSALSDAPPATPQ